METDYAGRFVKTETTPAILYLNSPDFNGNLIKQLFHSRLLDMRLVIAKSALRASLAIYHLISNARSWLLME